MNIKASQLIAKSVGVTGLGMVLYDSHNLGKIEAAAHQKKCGANTTSMAFENTLSLNNPSIVEDKVKKGISRFVMDEGILEFWDGLVGYTKGFSNMLTTHVIPLGLSVATLATKGTASKVFGYGLLTYGSIFMLREFAGFFKEKELT